LNLPADVLKLIAEAPSIGRLYESALSWELPKDVAKFFEGMADADKAGLLRALLDDLPIGDHGSAAAGVREAGRGRAEELEGSAAAMLSLAEMARAGGGATTVAEVGMAYICSLLEGVKPPLQAPTAASAVDDDDDAGLQYEPDVSQRRAAAARRAALRAQTAVGFQAAVQARFQLQLHQESNLAALLDPASMCDDCGRLPVQVACLCYASYARRCAVCDFYEHCRRGGGSVCKRWLRIIVDEKLDTSYVTFRMTPNEIPTLHGSAGDLGGALERAVARSLVLEAAGTAIHRSMDHSTFEDRVSGPPIFSNCCFSFPLQLPHPLPPPSHRFRCMAMQ
jgi:hypothetical protein